MAKKNVFFSGKMCGGTTIENEVERISRDDRSSHSISSGILPSLGAHSNRKAKLRPFIISPLDSRYRFLSSHFKQYFKLLFISYLDWGEEEKRGLNTFEIVT